MYIVFSQVFPWSETGRKDDSGEPLSCSDMYPNTILISGCFQIAFVFEELITGVLLARLAHQALAREQAVLDEAKARKIYAINLFFSVAMLVINIMTWVYLFRSDKECGPELWNFGVATFVLSFFQSCIATVGRRGRDGDR